MGNVSVTPAQTRVRCPDDKFLEAIFSSKTYAEIAEKTGQKLNTTIARYSRVKKTLLENGQTIPEMQRSKPVRKLNNADSMVEIVRRLQATHSG